MLLVLSAAAQSTRGWQFYTSTAQAYEFGRDKVVSHSGYRSAYLRSTRSAYGRSFALLWQKLDATPYRGHTVRLSGWLRTSGVSGWAGMWMRVDPENGPTLAFENMEKRPVTGSTEWREYSIELEVPQQAEEIHLGPLLVGQGEVWFDDLRLSITGTFVPGAEEIRRTRHLPTKIVDPGFEAPSP